MHKHVVDKARGARRLRSKLGRSRAILCTGPARRNGLPVFESVVGAGPASKCQSVMPTLVRTLILILVLVAGCVTRPQGPAEARSSAIVSESRAIEVARAAVAANDDWVERATFEPRRKDDGWVVYVERQEAGPNGEPFSVAGGHRFVFIDAHGNVTAYHRGR